MIGKRSYDFRGRARTLARSGASGSEAAGHDRLAVVAVDDTDDLTKATSTGAIAKAVADEARALGGTLRFDVTRHQLLLRDDVPYTSHNSAMAFEVWLPSGASEQLLERAVKAVESRRAPTSNPGLAIADLPADFAQALMAREAPAMSRAGLDLPRSGGAGESLEEGFAVGLESRRGDGPATPRAGLDLPCPDTTGESTEGDRADDPEFWKDDESARLRAEITRLVAFGRRAKEEFCPVEEAQRLADGLPWVRLVRVGGNGDGLVGALAGAGLRLSGDDGRFRGQWDLRKLFPDRVSDGLPVTVEQVRQRLEALMGGPVQLLEMDGRELEGSLRVVEEARMKPVLAGGKLTVLCDVVDGRAHPCAKVDLGEVGNGSWRRTCGRFEWDNDAGEMDGVVKSCRNCLHRRWTERGFECTIAP